MYEDYYTRQVGHGLPVFAGGMTQQGFGIGGLLARGLRAAIPILKPLMKRGAKTVVKTVLKKGARSALARKALNVGIDYAAGALDSRLNKGPKARSAAKKRRAVKQRQRGVKKRKTVLN